MALAVMTSSSAVPCTARARHKVTRCCPRAQAQAQADAMGSACPVCSFEHQGARCWVLACMMRSSTCTALWAPMRCALLTTCVSRLASATAPHVLPQHLECQGLRQGLGASHVKGQGPALALGPASQPDSSPAGSQGRPCLSPGHAASRSRKPGLTGLAQCMTSQPGQLDR